MNQVQVVSKTEITLDMEKIAIIGIAKGEKKFKERLKTLKAELSKVDKEIEELSEKLKSEAKVAVPEKVKNAVSSFENAIKSLEIKTKVEMNIEVHLHTKKNNFSVQLANNVGYGMRKFELFESSSDFSDSQNRILSDIESREKKLEELSSELIDLRRKLADVPGLERQIKANIAEQELKKTEEGRQILSTLDNGFEESIRLLGV